MVRAKSSLWRRSPAVFSFAGCLRVPRQGVGLSIFPAGQFHLSSAVANNVNHQSPSGWKVAARLRSYRDPFPGVGRSPEVLLRNDRRMIGPVQRPVQRAPRLTEDGPLAALAQ